MDAGLKAASKSRALGQGRAQARHAKGGWRLKVVLRGTRWHGRAVAGGEVLVGGRQHKNLRKSGAGEGNKSAHPTH